VGEECVDESGRVLIAEWLELDDAGARPVRARVEELRSRRASNQGRGPGEPDDVLDEVEQGRLRPVDVVYDRDQRPIACHVLEEDACRPEDLLRPRRLVGCTDGSEQSLRSERLIGPLSQDRPEPCTRIGTGDLPNDLAERPVRDPVAV
jgi:hypothetical protein